MVIPLLDAIGNIEGKVITTDALLTQRKLAAYLVEQRKAHYLFTVKGNQPNLLADLELFFRDRGKPDYVEPHELGHGRITCRRIWTTTDLNGYLNFPHVGQAFLIEREVTNKKTGKTTIEYVYGVTSLTAEQAEPSRVLQLNRGHWTIEDQCHYIIDWNFDEDRSRIRKGHGPTNVTRFRRFAVGLLKSRGVTNIAEKFRHLRGRPRIVLDYLKMTENSRFPKFKLASA
jgi:predicted transposase YbfD/YdcC